MKQSLQEFSSITILANNSVVFKMIKSTKQMVLCSLKNKAPLKQVKGGIAPIDRDKELYV